MSSLSPVPTVCFIACEKSTADHFATFIKKRPSDVNNVCVCGSNGYVWKLFQSHCFEPFNFDPDSKSPEVLAKQIAEKCLQSNASVVMTDVGHPFDVHLQQAFAEYAPKVYRIAYYENLYPYVADNEGVYSKTASAVMSQAQMVLFANANLARNDAILFETPNKPVDLSNQTKRWVGYYPNLEDLKLKVWREDFTNTVPNTVRFFNIHLPECLNGAGSFLPKILVYFGGTSEKYFNKDFPAFLSLLEQAMQTSSLKDLVIVLQQHPNTQDEQRRRGIDMRDSNLLYKWKATHKEPPHAPTFVFSHHSQQEIQSVADGVIYSDIDIVPHIAFAGIPLLQVGETVNADILVRNELITTLTPDTTTGKLFASALHDLAKNNATIPIEYLYQTLGCIETTEAVKHLWEILKNPFYEPPFEYSEDEGELEEFAEPTVKEPEPLKNAVPARKFQINPAHWPYYLAATVALVSLVAIAVRFWQRRVK